MVKEQGCGQKGQGGPEHLWAFMDLVEEGMEGAPAEGDGAGAQPGAYALFARGLQGKECLVGDVNRTIIRPCYWH